MNNIKDFSGRYKVKVTRPKPVDIIKKEKQQEDKNQEEYGLYQITIDSISKDIKNLEARLRNITQSGFEKTNTITPSLIDPYASVIQYKAAFKNKYVEKIKNYQKIISIKLLRQS